MAAIDWDAILEGLEDTERLIQQMAAMNRYREAMLDQEDHSVDTWPYVSGTGVKGSAYWQAYARKRSQG